MALPNGGSTTHTISAYLSIPSATVQKQVTLEIVHPEHVRAALIQRPPMSKARTEQLTLGAGIASDDGYRTLVVPDQEPDRTPTLQTRVTDADLSDLFALLGWERQS